MSHNTLLSDRSDDKQTTADGYGDFFSNLLQITAGSECNNTLGEKLKKYVLEWLDKNPLDGFDEYSDQTYRRTYLGRDAASGWEAIVMTWKRGNHTRIHAHPQFAGYNLADGVFRIEIFEPAANGHVRLVDDRTVTAPCAFFAVGAKDRFDNHIHRITCLSETGHSLHIYSDDALRGQIYEEPSEPDRNHNHAQ